MKQLKFNLDNLFRLSTISAVQTFELENKSAEIVISTDVKSELSYELHIENGSTKSFVVLNKNESSVSCTLTGSMLKLGVNKIQIRGIGANNYAIESNRVEFTVKSFINASTAPLPSEQTAFEALVVTVNGISNDVEDLESDKQDKLTAGANISISSENVISAANTTYTAGANITISSDNVISATGGGGGQSYVAGDNITINGDVISAVVPTKTSQLTNDSGFITEVPDVPTKTSELTNDSGFITASDVPSKTSDLTNDSGFITASDIPAIPSKTSQLQNDSDFTTTEQVAGQLDLKQDVLTAGANITISEDNVISATGGSGGSTVTMSDNAQGGVDLTVDGTSKTLSKETEVTSLNTALSELDGRVEAIEHSGGTEGFTPWLLNTGFEFVDTKISLMNPNEWSELGYYLQGNQTQASSQYTTRYRNSGLIKVKPNSTVTIKFISNGYNTCSYYLWTDLGTTATAQNVPNNVDSYEITIPSNINYIGFNYIYLANIGTLPSDIIGYAIEDSQKDYELPRLIAHKPFYGMKILNLGDSIFANARSENVSEFLEKFSGATVYNGAFGGTRMSVRTSDNAYEAFDGLNLVTALTSGDWTFQDTCIENVPTNYYPEVLNMLKNLDMSTIDIITIGWGTNDWGSGQPSDNSVVSALSSIIDMLQTAFPWIRILVLSPIRRFDGGDSDTVLHNGRTLLTCSDSIIAKAKEKHISVLDSYRNFEVSEANKSVYLLSDNIHPTTKGSEMYAHLINGKLSSIF